MHKLKTDLVKELQGTEYGKSKYKGLNDIITFSDFHEFVIRKYQRYAALIKSAKMTSSEFFTEVIAETMTGRVADTLTQTSQNQPEKYKSIVDSPTSFLTQVARLSILPAEANSVYDKAQNLPNSKWTTLKLYNQLKKLQTVSTVMEAVHGSASLQDDILLFILRNKMNPAIRAKVEADMVEKQYSLSTDGIDTFIVHRATQYEAALMSKGKQLSQLNMLTEETDKEEDDISEWTSEDSETFERVEDTDSEDNYIEQLHLLSDAVMNVTSPDKDDYHKLMEPIQNLQAMRRQDKSRKPKTQALKVMHNSERRKVSYPGTPQPFKQPQSNTKYASSDTTRATSCPLNWKPPSLAERRSRYATGQCTTCGSTEHFKANCPCASRMQQYVSKQPPIQRRFHALYDALAPDVNDMDDKEQDLHVQLLEYLASAEQSFSNNDQPFH